jgi:hypothetical protein
MGTRIVRPGNSRQKNAVLSKAVEVGFAIGRPKPLSSPALKDRVSPRRLMKPLEPLARPPVCVDTHFQRLNRPLPH